MLTELDSELLLVKNLRLVSENNNTAFEDVRLFSAGQRLLAFYTYLPQDDAGGWKWEYGVGVGFVNVNSGLITGQQSLRGFSKRMHEKNWCPYIVEDEIFLITDFDPYVRILKLGKLDGEIMPEEIYQSNIRTFGWKYGELRGGTPLLQGPQIDDGWRYGFIHSFLPSYQGYVRYYFYTAVRFNHFTHQVEYHPEPMEFDYNTSGSVYQELWWYSNHKTLKVIFPIGIMPHQDGVLVSFGVDDVTSVTQYYTWKYLFGLFVKL